MLKEAFEDVLLATKSCKRLEQGIHYLQQAVGQRQARRRLWQRLRPKLMAQRVLRELLETQRRAEVLGLEHQIQSNTLYTYIVTIVYCIL